LKAFMLLTEAPAGSFTRCPLDLNSHNHNQHAGRPCFSLAIQIEHSTSTLRYDISRLQNSASHVNAHAIRAHADCSPLHRETVEGGKINATWFVVPGSGTGALSGLRGEGGFEGEFGKGSEGTLDYWFE
jgi:hypothetical protein